MDYKLDWTERARTDLREIAATIAADRPSAVTDWGEDLFRHVELLATFPFIGPVVPQLGPMPTHRIVYGEYLVFYRVHRDSKMVEILSIWHGARGLPDFL